MIHIRRIVCPTDFSPTAAHALDYAAWMAETFAAHLLLLHVVPELDYPVLGIGMTSTLPHLREELRSKARERLQEAAAKLTAANVRSEVRDGSAAECILACAAEHEADLIIMGTHGHTGLKHVLLGSSAERVVRLSTCPVLTVRNPA
jgi:nucleotide-binding universal stress UspA family protein